MKYVVFDLEATCWKDKRPQQVSEIIEIGAVKLDEDLNEVGIFEKFVRPTISPVLSDFCKDLTSIGQYDVDNATGFKEVDYLFKRWCEGACLCSWGYYDLKKYNDDCYLHRVLPWIERHISVKHQYAVIRGIRDKGCGISEALGREGLKFEGTKHRGIDDAKNIVRIFTKIFPALKFP